MRVPDGELRGVEDRRDALVLPEGLVDDDALLRVFVGVPEAGELLRADVELDAAAVGDGVVERVGCVLGR